MKIMDTKEFGRLKLDRILYREGPEIILFSCTEIDNCERVLFYSIDADESKEEWIAARCSDKDIYELVNNKTSVAAKFAHLSIYSISHDLVTDVYTSNKADASCLSSFFPAEPLFIGEEAPDRSIIENTPSICERFQKPGSCLLFRLAPGHETFGLPVSYLCNFLDSVKSYVAKYLGEKYVGRNLKLATEHGSMCLLVYLEDSDKIGAASSSDCFLSLQKVVSAKDRDDAINALHEKPDCIEPAKKVLKALSKTEVDFDSFSKGDAENGPIESRTTIDMIKEFSEELGKTEITSEVSLSLTGNITAYNSRTGKFEFQSGSTKYSGKVAEHLRSVDEERKLRLNVPGLYSVELKETSIGVGGANGVTVKKIYSLMRANLMERSQSD